MQDYMITGMAYGNEARFYAAYTREMAEEARRIHNTAPVCTAALGRTLCAGAIMGAMCKNDSDLVTIRIDGDGPIHGITVTANAKAEVKGLVGQTKVELPLKPDKHLDVGQAVGRGTLSVIRDSGMGEPYTGQTTLVSGEIAEDITYYFAESEQIPTTAGLGVLVDRDRTVRHAGGFIIQLLPFASEETISSLEQAIGKVHSVTDYFEKGYSPEDLMKEILGEIRIEQTIIPKYRCNCSRERVERALISLGRKELQEMIDDGEEVKLHCDFCNKDYVFSIEEIRDCLTHAG